MTTRIFINGFGRIGRTVLRQVLSNIDTEQFEIVGINDVADPDTLTYLFKYDSIFGVWRDPVFFMQDRLVIDATSIPFTRKPSLTDLDLHGVDVLLECSGKVSSRSVAESSMTAGAHAVLISGPCEFADQTVVMDANNADLGDARIVSNASCTTNAIAPLLKMLDIGMGVEHAHVTTVHCYTGGQPTVDQVGTSFERSRAAAVSMIPTTTSAANLVTAVLPNLEGRISVAAVRVPSISVSAIDAVVQITEWPDEPIEEFLQHAFETSDTVGITHDACVSSDLRGRPESLIIALPEVQTVAEKQIRILGWYDNEWGFSARMLDMAERMASRNKE